MEFYSFGRLNIGLLGSENQSRIENGILTFSTIEIAEELGENAYLSGDGKRSTSQRK
jgi:hypothetical protein